MEAGQELYFLFRSVSGGVAQYRQEGGTRLYSEMAGLGMEQRLRYVHQHAKVTLDQVTYNANLEMIFLLLIILW